MKTSSIHGIEFIKAGFAINTPKRVNGADFKIDEKYKKAIGVVYLFVRNGNEIVYIGVTEKEIQSRMDMYASNTTGTTNIKMREYLQRDGVYDIYIHIAKEVEVGDLKTTNELTIEKALIQNMETLYNTKIAKKR